jgi:magnesium-transporting ATPase (P-type)
MCWGGTTVTSGKFIGIVAAISKETELGTIQKHFEEAEQLQSPLQIKLDKFGDIIFYRLFQSFYLVYNYFVQKKSTNLQIECFCSDKR